MSGVLDDVLACLDDSSLDKLKDVGNRDFLAPDINVLLMDYDRGEFTFNFLGFILECLGKKKYRSLYEYLDFVVDSVEVKNKQNTLNVVLSVFFYRYLDDDGIYTNINKELRQLQKDLIKYILDAYGCDLLVSYDIRPWGDVLKDER